MEETIWPEKVTNEEVLKSIGGKRALLKISSIDKPVGLEIL